MNKLAFDCYNELIALAAIAAVEKAICRLKPPDRASTSRTSPIKYRFFIRVDCIVLLYIFFISMPPLVMVAVVILSKSAIVTIAPVKTLNNFSCSCLVKLEQFFLLGRLDAAISRFAMFMGTNFLNK